MSAICLLYCYSYTENCAIMSVFKFSNTMTAIYNRHSEVGGYIYILIGFLYMYKLDSFPLLALKIKQKMYSASFYQPNMKQSDTHGGVP